MVKNKIETSSFRSLLYLYVALRLPLFFLGKSTFIFLPEWDHFVKAEAVCDKSSVLLFAYVFEWNLIVWDFFFSFEHPHFVAVHWVLCNILKHCCDRNVLEKQDSPFFLLQNFKINIKTNYHIWNNNSLCKSDENVPGLMSMEMEALSYLPKPFNNVLKTSIYILWSVYI